jgi:hypothetical protein
MTVNYGTLDAGTVSNLMAIGGTDVAISEVVGANALQVVFDFTGITQMSVLTIYGRYSGSSTDKIAVELYNYESAQYIELGSITHTAEKTTYTFPLKNIHSYISASAVKLRLRHTTVGVATHDLYLDYIVLQNYQIRGFEIFRKSCKQNRVVLGTTKVEKLHTFGINGYLALDDSAETEKTFNTLLEAVSAAFQANKKLNSTCEYHNELQANVIDLRAFGSVLCHACELELEVMERV